MGFKPLWFRAPDFPHLHSNAMDNCLEVAARSDRMVVVLDERAGLLYEPLGITITEAEFERAFSRGVPILVFVRDRVLQQSRVYHRHAEEIRIKGKAYFSKLRLDGDEEVYAFIERLQHKTRDGKQAVPWITSFSFADDIVTHIREKWLLPTKAQAMALAALRKNVENPSKKQVGTRRGVVATELVVQALRALTKRQRLLIERRIGDLQGAMAMGRGDPMYVKRLLLTPGLTHYELRLSPELRLVVRVEEDKTLVIVGLMQRRGDRSELVRLEKEAMMGESAPFDSVIPGHDFDIK